MRLLGADAAAQPPRQATAWLIMTFGNKNKMPIIDEIRDALIIAAEEKTKTATLHSLVLIHSRELEKMEPLEFCRLAGIAEAYHIEFRKMISASRMLRELGYSIEKK